MLKLHSLKLFSFQGWKIKLCKIHKYTFCSRKKITVKNFELAEIVNNVKRTDSKSFGQSKASQFKKQTFRMQAYLGNYKFLRYGSSIFTRNYTSCTFNRLLFRFKRHFSLCAQVCYVIEKLKSEKWVKNRKSSGTF